MLDRPICGGASRYGEISVLTGRHDTMAAGTTSCLGKPLSLTVGVGIVTQVTEAPATLDALVQAVAPALYAAKNAGRDRAAAA